MNNNSYLYKPKPNLKTIKDLEYELKKASLHQQFLKEVINKDKELVVDAFSFQNIFQNGLNAIMNNSFTNDNKDENKSNSMFYTLAKWLFVIFIKKDNQ